MKYICLGYFDEKKWETMSESEQKAFMDECFAYANVATRVARLRRLQEASPIPVDFRSLVTLMQPRFKES